ncbi:partial Threonylcarbamoyladenosine tRNA methylthiotransferase MtaB, partial [Anaerolineae bacterium]
GFGHIHIFSYSKREGTKAATLPEQISEAVKKQRSGQLHQLAHQLKHEFYNANLGKIFPVLWEGHKENLGNGKQRVFGYTPNYLRVACEIDENLNIENQTINTRLVQAADGFILGEL